MHLPPLPPSDDRYELLGELGVGGMATVYLGRQRGPRGFSKLVAIKCLHPQLVEDDTLSALVLDEARLGARIRHPNVVSTLDVVVGPDRPFSVMEYVDGDALSALMRAARERGEPTPVPIACAILHDVLCGLHAAHETCDENDEPLAIIHRDVSPQNVMVGVDGLARLLDFGVAKARGQMHHTVEGEIKGKIGYMPPEQLFAEPLDRTADVYGAGVILWELLAGERLYEGTITQRLNERRPVAPSKKARATVSAELDALTMRAIAVDKAKRFPTALAMANALATASPLAPRLEVARWMQALASERLARRRSLVATAAARCAQEDAVEATTVTVPPADMPSRRRMFGIVGLALVVGAASVLRLVDADDVPPRALQMRVAPAYAALPHATARAPATAVTATVRDARPRPPGDCRLPYVVDGAGHRHFRLECL